VVLEACAFTSPVENIPPLSGAKSIYFSIVKGKSLLNTIAIKPITEEQNMRPLISKPPWSVVPPYPTTVHHSFRDIRSEFRAISAHSQTTTSFRYRLFFFMNTISLHSHCTAHSSPLASNEILSTISFPKRSNSAKKKKKI